MNSNGQQVIMVLVAGVALVGFVAWYNREKFNREVFNAQVSEQLALDRQWWQSGSPDYITSTDSLKVSGSQWGNYGVLPPYFR